MSPANGHPVPRPQPPPPLQPAAPPHAVKGHPTLDCESSEPPAAAAGEAVRKNGQQRQRPAARNPAADLNRPQPWCGFLDSGPLSGLRATHQQAKPSIRRPPPRATEPGSLDQEPGGRAKLPGLPPGPPPSDGPLVTWCCGIDPRQEPPEVVTGPDPDHLSTPSSLAWECAPERRRWYPFAQPG